MVRYCPAGDGAFEDWVERCPDCGRPLTETDPTMAPAKTRQQEPNDAVVYLATASNEPLAQFWLEVLRDAGIVAMAKALGPGFAAWGSNATFEHEIYVVQSRLDEAREIIEDLSSGEIVTEDDGGSINGADN